MKSEFRVIGIMSGTSLDGLDVVYCQFKKEGENWSFCIKVGETYAYNNYWKRHLSTSRDLSANALKELDREFGAYCGQEVVRFLEKHQIPKSEVDFIGSHGHTVHHQPNLGYTIQIGCGKTMCDITGIRVINNFRVQDVQLGGQGAPLVPIGDKLLFPTIDGCVNLGGFANISFDYRSKRIAYDICPLNVIMNKLAQDLNLDYDANGDIARKGVINYDLLKKWNSLTYYSKSFPKSLGVEWVEENFDLLADTPSNLLATMIAHASDQIAQQINFFNLQKVLFSGGGVWNTYLMEQIGKKTNTEIVSGSENLIEFKEALIFGFLAVLKSINQNNVLASVTGASKDHCAGYSFG